MNRWLSMMVSPLLTAGLLAGMTIEHSTHLQPADADPFHAQAKAAIDGIRYHLGDWFGQDNVVPHAATRLLHPNAILSRTYHSADGLHQATLLIVQTRDTRDMGGHYPPVCYRANGQELMRQESHDWAVGPLKIPGMEYEFRGIDPNNQPFRQVVYDFMIVPRKGMCRDMSGIRKAAEDYQGRNFGAAQFQLVMSAESSQEDRDQMFQDLIGPIVPVIQLLVSGGIR